MLVKLLCWVCLRMIVWPNLSQLCILVSYEIFAWSLHGNFYKEFGDRLVYMHYELLKILKQNLGNATDSVFSMLFKFSNLILFIIIKLTSQCMYIRSTWFQKSEKIFPSSTFYKQIKLNYIILKIIFKT